MNFKTLFAVFSLLFTMTSVAHASTVLYDCHSQNGDGYQIVTQDDGKTYLMYKNNTTFESFAVSAHCASIELISTVTTSGIRFDNVCSKNYGMAPIVQINTAKGSDGSTQGTFHNWQFFETQGADLNQIGITCSK